MSVCECRHCHAQADGIDKWRYTLYTTIVLLIVLNPFTYKLVNSLFKSVIKICDSNGCPTTSGFLIHSAVFTIIVRYLMDYDI